MNMNDATGATATSSPLQQVRRVSGGSGESLVEMAVASLRRSVLAIGPDLFLGSEDQLIEALGISRPTFRQVTKLLMHENLIVIKRGVGGGFFTRAPSSEAVTRLAAIYLNSHGTSMRQVHDVMVPLQTEAARQLAMNPDRAMRACLSDFLANDQAAETSINEHAPIIRMLRFERLLGEKAGNPAIALVMNMMRDLVRDERRVHFLLKPERIASHEDFQKRLAQAILEGDVEMSTLICNRHNALFRTWLPEETVAGAGNPG